MSNEILQLHWSTANDVLLLLGYLHINLRSTQIGQPRRGEVQTRLGFPLFPTSMDGQPLG